MSKVLLSEQVLPGIYKISIPLPGMPPGPINAYLFVGRKVSLLDTGSRRGIKVLEKALKELGFNLADIDNIVVTHGHLDHYGCARIIKKSSKAKVIVHEDDRAWVEKGGDVSRRTKHNFLTLMGVPVASQIVIGLTDLFLLHLGQSCPVDDTVDDGDMLEMGDYSLKVIHTPGHSPGSICLYLPEQNVVFTGDHILGHITPNALVMLKDGQEIPVRMSQEEFYSSIRKIELLQPDQAFPGHGKIINNLEQITTNYRSDFQKRQESIMKIVGGVEQTVFQIAEKLFVYLKSSQFLFETYLAVSEVYTHLQLLEHEKRVISCQKANKLLFTSVQ